MLLTGRKTKRRGRYSTYNKPKKQALEIFRQRGWFNPAAWAMLAGFFPVRASYSYLGRLHAWGLLERARSQRGLVLCRLSSKGASRLAWLATPQSPVVGSLSLREECQRTSRATFGARRFVRHRSRHDHLPDRRTSQGVSRLVMIKVSENFSSRASAFRN